MNCRAVTAEGDVRLQSETDAGPAIGNGDEIPLDAWLSISRGGRLVAKDPRTTRETIFAGPALVRPCVGHREDSWLASGVFESTPGAGETPGAEEWIETPLAVVRYGAAKVRVVVRPEATTVTMAGGVSFVRVQDDARVSLAARTTPVDAGPKSQDPWLRLSEGSVDIRPLRRLSSTEAARSSVDECASLAGRAEALARLVLPRDGGEVGNASVRDAIVEQVTTRRLARAACAVAALRVQGLPASPDRTSWLAALSDAELRWSTLPSSTVPR